MMKRVHLNVNQLQSIAKAATWTAGALRTGLICHIFKILIKKNEKFSRNNAFYFYIENIIIIIIESNPVWLTMKMEEKKFVLN